MLLKTKHCPYSQAGRRGFDPRLPLHLFNSRLKVLQNSLHISGSEDQAASIAIFGLSWISFMRVECVRRIT
jgi:hypothetical protein